MALAVSCDVCGNVITNMDVNQDVYYCIVKHYKLRSYIDDERFRVPENEQAVHICPKCYNKLLVLTKYKLAV